MTPLELDIIELGVDATIALANENFGRRAKRIRVIAHRAAVAEHGGRTTRPTNRRPRLTRDPWGAG